MTEMGGVDYVREVFEKALMSIGLHTAEVCVSLVGVY